MKKIILSTLLLFAAAVFNSCKEGCTGDPNPPQLAVTPETLTFGSDGEPSSETGGVFTLEAGSSWQAKVEPGQEWLTLSPTQGTGDGTVAVTIPTPIAEGGRAAITFCIDNSNIKQTVYVVLEKASLPPVPPEDVTITVDFSQGAGIAVPELPAYSKEQVTNGRGEYTIEGYPFAIFADAAENGKYNWIDNSQFSPSIPEPNKGLYFSKLGAYIELPALENKALSEVVYTATTSAGDVSLEIVDTDDAFVSHTLIPGDDGLTQTFTLIEPAVNTRYRIEVMNKKNAQVSKLVLTYKGQ